MTYTEKQEKIYKAFLEEKTVQLTYKEYGFLILTSGLYENEFNSDEKKEIDRIYDAYIEPNEKKT